MALYTGPGMELNEANEKVLARRVEDFYLSCQPYVNTYWGEADTDVRFECGDQTVNYHAVYKSSLIDLEVLLG